MTQIDCYLFENISGLWKNNANNPNFKVIAAWKFKDRLQVLVSDNVTDKQYDFKNMIEFIHAMKTGTLNRYGVE